MAREQRTGDWAAWMGAPVPAQPRPPVSPVTPADESRTTVVDERRRAESAAPDAALDGHASAEPEAEGQPAHRSARREATRQRLLDAAREVFAERGVIGGSVEDICERAGFTRGAFYSNFTDKDEVVGALIEREQARLIEHLGASVQQVEPEIAEAWDLPSALGSIVDRILRSVPVDRQLLLIQTELEIHAIRRPDLSRQLLEVNSRFRDLLGTFIDEAIRRNGRELVVSPAYVVDSVIAVTERSVRRALLQGGGADPDAMASAVLPGILLALSRPLPTEEREAAAGSA